MYDNATVVAPGASRSFSDRAVTQSAQSSPPITLTVASTSSGVAGSISTRRVARPPPSKSTEWVIARSPRA